MEWAALITWVLTAGGGFVLLSIWLARGGMKSQTAGNRIKPPLIMSHFLLAATGLVLWIIYVVNDSTATWKPSRPRPRQSRSSDARMVTAGRSRAARPSSSPNE